MSTSFEHWVTKYKIEPTGILHAGAHLVQERDLYLNLKMEPVIWVEAHPATAHMAEKLLVDYPNQRIVNAALWSRSGEEITLREAGNEGSSSSLLELGLITGSHPEVVCSNEITVITRTLAEILDREMDLSEKISFLCIDTQGAEAEVIKGLGTRITSINYILAEVSIRKLYKKAVLFPELTSQLANLDFKLIASNVNKNTGWGDALYVRNSEVERIGIKEEDCEYILTNDSNGFGTRIRYLLLSLGIPNKIVSRISKRN